MKTTRRQHRRCLPTAAHPGDSQRQRVAPDVRQRQVEHEPPDQHSGTDVDVGVIPRRHEERIPSMSAARRSRTRGSSKTRKSVADGCPSVLRASGKCASRARKNDAANRTVRWVTQGYRCATARSSAAFASILIRTAFGRSSRFVTVPASTAATRSVGVMRSKSAAVMIRRSGMRFRLPGSETPERRSRLRRVRKPSHPLCVGRLDGRVLQKRPHDAPATPGHRSLLDFCLFVVSAWRRRRERVDDGGPAAPHIVDVSGDQREVVFERSRCHQTIDHGHRIGNR